MRNRLPEHPELTKLLLNLEPHHRANNCKVLPYLKSINCHQPIDYRLYENLKKVRKVKVVRLERPADLFLEGEMAFSAPR
jgi:hypothetical protein